MNDKLVRGFLSIFSARIARVILLIIITPILVRLLGSSLYGDYAFVLSVISISMILVNSGMYDGVRKFIAEDRSLSNWKENVFSFYLRIGCVFMVIASSIVILLSISGVVSNFLGQEFETYFYLVALVIVSRQLFMITRSALMGLDLEYYSEPITVIQKSLFGIVGLSLAYLGHGVDGVLVGHVVGTLTASLLGFGILMRYLDISAIIHQTPPDFPRYELLSFNGWSVLLILLTASLFHVDILILQPVSGSQETGYYRAAITVAEFIWFIPIVLETVLLHSTSKLWADDEREKITSLTSRITRYNILITLLCLIGLAALADSFIPLYFSSEFEASIPPLLLLLPGIFGFGVARPIYATGQGKGDLRILIIATGLAAVSNLVLNVLLIPMYGMYGAAIATSASYGSMMIFHIFVAQLIGFNPVNDLRLKSVLITAILSMPIIFAFANLFSSPILSLIFVPPIGFICYSMIALYSNAIDVNELRMIVEYTPQPVKKYGDILIKMVDN